MTLREFVCGPAAWRQGAGVGAVQAAAATLLIFVAAQVFTAGVVYVVALTALTSGAGHDASAPRDAPAVDMRLLLAGQAAIAVLTWLVARRGSMTAAAHLRLVRPDGGGTVYAWAVVSLLPVLALVNAIAWTLRPEDALRDFQLFRDVARSPEPLVPFLAIAVGAPLAEELLFRGFLLTALASGRLGFAGAAVIVTAAWTLLHWGYSATGLAEVAVIGLYLAWTLWRTGSLLVPICCHALYNACLFLLLRWWPA